MLEALFNKVAGLKEHLQTTASGNRLFGYGTKKYECGFHNMITGMNTFIALKEAM